MSDTELKTLCVIGASRGLGRAIALEALGRGFERFFLLARNSENLELLKSDIIALEQSVSVQTSAIDFSKDSAVSAFVQFIGSQAIHSLIYCAGGGGHGSYGGLSWNSHSWTFRVNLLAPAELIHWAMNHTPAPQHVIVVGSALADQAPEPFGASYSAAKSGLRGLIQSLQSDHKQAVRLHIFRPGFLDTSILPKGSWPRRIEGLVESPALAACRLLDLVSDPPSGG